MVKYHNLWKQNFEKLHRFRNDHGRWPVQKRDGALGNWCIYLRQAKKGRNKGKISQVQISKLDSIGFDWDPNLKLNNKWNENFEKLKLFHIENERWPKNNEGPLGKWCHNQRQAKKGKGSQRISATRITKLDGIGFDWGMTFTGTPEERWNQSFEEVKQFYIRNGRWPNCYDEKVFRWCRTQRQAKKGIGHRKISTERIAKLDQIGFDWGRSMTVKQLLKMRDN